VKESDFSPAVISRWLGWGKNGSGVRCFVWFNTRNTMRHGITQHGVDTGLGRGKTDLSSHWRGLYVHWRGLESLSGLPHVIGALLCQPQPGLASTRHAQPCLDTQGHFRLYGSAAIQYAGQRHAGHIELLRGLRDC
jgi:hypothetical protein